MPFLKFISQAISQSFNLFQHMLDILGILIDNIETLTASFKSLQVEFQICAHAWRRKLDQFLAQFHHRLHLLLGFTEFPSNLGRATYLVFLSFDIPG